MSYFAKFVNVARYEATLRKVLFLKHTEISKTQYFSYVIKNSVLYQDGDIKSSLNHLLQHTIICSSDYGEGPSALTQPPHLLTQVSLSALQLRSDIQSMPTFSTGLSPSPARSYLFGVNLLSPSKSLVHMKFNS